MKLNHEGLSLWYGTPDAPAPLDAVVARDGASLVAGVHPANPTNALNVRYRVDRGVVQSAAGRQLHTDYAKNSQYFAVPFPPFPVGRVVEYCPIFTSAGRQVPSPAMAEHFPSKFFLEDKPAARKSARVQPSAGGGQRYAPELKFIAALTVWGDIQYLGATPEGARVDYFVREGGLVGPGFNAKVYPGSADHMFVRPDGVGVVRVRAELIADDGAKFEVESIGSADFGDDGYSRAVAGKLPSRAPVVLCPRILTGHPKYLWLNRIQCIGVGGTYLDEGRVEYDLFSITSPVGPPKG